MTPLKIVEGIAAPLLRENIDTDIIVPSREITSPGREGYGAKAFAPWRYCAPGGPENEGFVLNRAPYRQAVILIAGANFGCGSSREMAVWALAQFGLRVLIAPSFGAIFRVNCIRNGVLTIELSDADIARLGALAETHPSRWRVDLDSCCITPPAGAAIGFKVDADDREVLLTGLDAIDRTWQQRAAIEAFEREDRLRRPWVWASPRGV